MDFLADGASEVIERFTDVWRIVVGFVGVLRADDYQGGVVRDKNDGVFVTYVTCKSF